MMIGLGVEQSKGSSENVTHDFEKAVNVTVISSMPSNPDSLKISFSLCNNSDQILDFYDSTPGLKMMFAQGSPYKTNMELQDNEFEYYRLIGEAYNKNILQRASHVNNTGS